MILNRNILNKETLALSPLSTGLLHLRKFFLSPSDSRKLSIHTMHSSSYTRGEFGTMRNPRREIVSRSAKFSRYRTRICTVCADVCHACVHRMHSVRQRSKNVNKPRADSLAIHRGRCVQARVVLKTFRCFVLKSIISPSIRF